MAEIFSNDRAEDLKYITPGSDYFVPLLRRQLFGKILLSKSDRSQGARAAPWSTLAHFELQTSLARRLRKSLKVPCERCLTLLWVLGLSLSGPTTFSGCGNWRFSEVPRSRSGQAIGRSGYVSLGFIMPRGL